MLSLDIEKYKRKIIIVDPKVPIHSRLQQKRNDILVLYHAESFITRIKLYWKFLFCYKNNSSPQAQAYTSSMVLRIL